MMRARWIPLLALLWGLSARAQTVTINVGVAAGSGLEIGRAESTQVRHSPAFVALQGGLLFDNDQRFEIGASLLAELEGRVGLAIEPQLRINTPTDRYRAYLVAGVPIFVAPYSLYGLALGPGFSVRVWQKLRVFGELMFRAYPFGTDLPEGASLFHVDLAVGGRYAF